MYYLEASPKTWSSLSEREYRSVLPGPWNRGFRLESDRFAPTPLPFTWKWSLLWKLSCKCLLVLLACRWRSLLLFRVMAGNRVIISGDNPPFGVAKSFCGGSQFRLIFVQLCLTKAPCVWAVQKKNLKDAKTRNSRKYLQTQVAVCQANFRFLFLKTKWNFSQRWQQFH